MDHQSQEWVVVLVEPRCGDTQARTVEWRQEFDPGYVIPDEDIKIETYTDWKNPDSLRISVRRRRLGDDLG